jgi:streptogramin lyase/serine/threonine protein kinase
MLIELVHPSIVRVLDSGLDQGTAYLVMDYAPNGTLRQRYPRGSQLKLSTIIPLIQQITAGLRYTHRARVVHQGISPEHLLLGRHDEVLISDFENTILNDNPQKKAQQMAGRVTYMAPEQLRGEAVPESDQYALGIMAYEWLTGAPPFQGSWREVAHQHALIPPLPLHEKLPGISRGVEEVILTALAKEPGQRFPSVQAFTAYLTHASNEALDMFTMTFPAEMPSSAFLWQVTSPEISSMMRAISAPLKALPPPPETGRPPISGPVKPGSGSMRPSQQEALEILKEPPLHVGAAASTQITIEHPPSNGPAHMPFAPGRSSPVPTSDVPGTNGHIVVKKSHQRDIIRMTIALLVIALIGGMELFGFLGQGPFSFMSPHPAQAIPGSSTRSSAGARTPVPSATPAVRITAFALPTGSGGPLDITVGPDGSLWFTEPQSNRIGRMTPQGAVTEFPLPNANSQPVAIVKGPDGALWFTEQQGNQIGRITPQGIISEFPLPIANSQPMGIVAAPDGNLWFTELISNRIGRITPDGTFLDGFALPNDNSQPAGITIGPDGALWFTEQQGNQIGRITPQGAITEFSVPTPNCQPDAIIVGPDGALWFTEQQGNQIGRLISGR